jgi:hypothetical protein
MPKLQIHHERVLHQRISGEGLDGPGAVARWMGAVQAQDYTAAKWAVGLRTQACTDMQLEEALNSGEILRTHVMRPTWHFVAPEDIRWMQALTAPRVHALNALYYRRLELDAAVFKKTNRVLAAALRGGRQLTRAELGKVLAKAGIQTNGLRLVYILMWAELDAIICSGGRRGKQFTHALTEERAPHAKQLPRDEALALLTERYFTSHGPATIRDYAWWSGLAAADVKSGLEMVKSRLVSESIGGQEYWMTSSAPAARFRRGSVHLLPNFDEYVVGYTDRKEIFDDIHAQHLDARHNPLFQHIIVSSGQIVGTWKRTVTRDSLAIQAKIFQGPTKVQVRALGLATEQLAVFMGLTISEFRF